MRSATFAMLAAAATALAASAAAGADRSGVGVAQSPVAAATSQTSAAAADADRAARVARGEYLVTALGCGDCHTPKKSGPHGPEFDSSRYLSGHPQAIAMPAPPAAAGPWTWNGAATGTAFAGPWGISYAANLTPDASTGLVGWSEERFIETMRTGRHLGVGRPLLPPMPWQAFGHFDDEDLRSMFDYLQTIPPVKNQVPAAAPAAPPR